MGVTTEKLAHLSQTKQLLREAINGVLYDRSEPLLTESTPFEDYPSALYALSPAPSAGSLAGPISDKLLRLNETKNRLREAINAELGAGLVAGDSFRAYVDAMWTPRALFTQGEQGAWYDPSDLATLYQDAAGTVPVSADGDPVGLIQDKSGNGNHASQSVAASRPIYRTDGALHWLEFDGVDDWFDAGILGISQPFTLVSAHRLDGFNNRSFKTILGARGGPPGVVQLGHTSLSAGAEMESRFYAGNTVAGFGTLPVGAKAVLTGQYAGASSIGRQNKVDGAIKDWGALDLYSGTFSVGGIRTGNELNGAFYGAAVYQGQRKSVEETERYFAAKAGVTL